MSPEELEELGKQLGKLLESKSIFPSNSPFGVSILFQHKKDNNLHMCNDYRMLNKITVKNKYHVPLIVNLSTDYSRQ